MMDEWNAYVERNWKWLRWVFGAIVLGLIVAVGAVEKYL